MSSSRERSLAWILPLALIACGDRDAHRVPPGYDYLRTTSGAEFRFESLPIPAGFFGRSSEPYTGALRFEGGGPLPPERFDGEDISHVDTIVERLDEVELSPPFPSSAETRIRLTALSLKSVEPLEIRVGNHTEIWDVEVGVSEARPSAGTMRITKTSAEGGTFDSELAVFPSFHFIRRCDGRTLTLDTGELALDDAQVESMKLRSARTPWLHHAPGTLRRKGRNDRFVAGAPDAFNEDGEMKAHPVEEAPDCDVVILANSRNICVGRTRNFSGKGSPAGGSYSWSIVQGGSRASITGGGSSKNVTVRADAPSASVLDTRLKVDYDCPGGGTATASIGITEIQAELSFHGDGEASPDNQAAMLPENVGQNCFPRLGPQLPDASCRKWGANQETEARITPSANLSATFDFERTRQGAVNWTLADGTRMPVGPQCPTPCSDPTGAKSEDVTLSQAGTIFLLDSPGVTVNPQGPATCGGDATLLDGATFQFCQNFEDRLLVDGQECGSRIPWQLQFSGDCQSGLLVNMPVPALNEGNTGCANTIVSTGSFSFPEAVKLIESDDTETRVGARNLLAEALAEGDLSDADLQRMEGELIRIAEERSSETAFASPLMFALELLGSMKAEQAIPIFVEHLLDFRQPPPGRSRTPAESALRALGASAAPAMIERAGSATDPEWALLEAVLDEMDGEGVVERQICAAFDAGPSATAEKRLAGVLERRRGR